VAGKLRVGLESVGFVDERGKELPAEIYTAGVELWVNGLILMMTSLVGIAANCSLGAK
jgi:hypothetical protein